MNKSVAVIVPIYNSDRFIRKCLDSILCSTYKNILVICVNDGSTDNSLNILKEYRNNIIVINQKNKGASMARNVGIAKAKELSADFICFCDADDYIDGSFIKRGIHFIINYNTDIYISSVQFYSTKPIIKHPVFSIKNGYPICLSSFDLLNYYIKEDMFPVFHGKIFKISLFSNVKVETKCVIGEDVVTLFDLYANANNAVCDDFTSYYINRDPSISSLTRRPNDNKKLMSIIRCHYIVLEKSFKMSLPNNNGEILAREAINVFAYNYLMLMPRISYKHRDTTTISEINHYKEFIKKMKIIKKYTPNCKKEKIKKMLYLLSPTLYPHIYRLIVWFSKE